MGDDGRAAARRAARSGLLAAQRGVYDELVRQAQERLKLEQEVQQAQKLGEVGMLAAKMAHEIGTPLNVILGRAEVRDTFRIPKVGTIAGCFVQDGTIKRDAEVRLLRDNVQVFKGKVSSLRRFKDDVSEVKSGFECGIGLQNYNDVKVGDVIEVFTMERVAVTA